MIRLATGIYKALYTLYAFLLVGLLIISNEFKPLAESTDKKLVYLQFGYQPDLVDWFKFLSGCAIVLFVLFIVRAWYVS